MKWRERVIDANAGKSKADLTRMLGKSNIGESLLMLDNVDYACIINYEYDNDQSDFIITKQTNTMIIILKGYISFNTTNIDTITSVLKVYLLNNQNIQKVHVVISPKVSYGAILSFLMIIVPLLSKYIKKKIVVHQYNTLKLISKRIPSILNALPSYIKKRIIIDGSRGVTIGHMNFLCVMMDGMYVLTVRRSRL